MKLLVKPESDVKLRGCILVPRFPPQYSGAGKRGEEFARYLSEQGYPVMVIAFKESHEASYVSEKFNVYYYQPFTPPGYLAKLCYAASLIISAFKHHKKYDCIFCYGVLTIDAAWMRLFGKKIVYRATLKDADDFPRILSSEFRRLKFLTAFRRWYYKKIIMNMISYHWAISQEMRRDLLELGVPREKIIYAPNGVVIEDTAAPAAGAQEDTGNREHFNFLFVGAVCRRKGIDLLTGLFEQLVKHVPQARLNIAGPIEDQVLYQQVAALPHVSYLGIVDNINALLEANDFFLFPSRKEGFPTAVIEAMAKGLVCITSKLPVIEDDIIDHGINGFCMDFENTEAAVGLIRSLLENSSKRSSVSAKAVRKVQEKFDSGHNYRKVAARTLGRLQC